MSVLMSCEASLNAGETLHGSGASHGCYLLVEYNTPWPYDAAEHFVENVFGNAEREHFNTMMASLPDARLLMLRGRAGETGKIRAYVANPREQNPTLYHFVLDSYSQILDLDIAAMLNDSPEYEKYRHDEPLYLICTHGKRDACCAREGLPVYNTIKEIVSQQTWQVSHIGGHRLAGTMVCMPHGLYYGRVTPQIAPRIVETYQTDRVLNTLYRGRACYDAMAQAGEYFLRRDTGEDHNDAFRLIEREAVDDTIVRLRFQMTGSGVVHSLTISQRMSDQSVLSTTGTTKYKAFPIFSLLDHSTETVTS